MATEYPSNSEERHWFPLLAVGSSLALLAFVGYHLKAQSVPLPPPSVQSLAPARERVVPANYEVAILELLANYGRISDAQKIYDSLVALTVPPSYLHVHYELVIAFGKLKDNKLSDGEARLSALQAQYPWLKL
ncbi:MAG: hypothetical protein AAB833_01165 [Patescibacteria group bacterium]